MEENLIRAIFAGQYGVGGQVLGAILLSTFGGAILMFLRSKALAGIDTASAAVNDTWLGRLSTIDDRFFDLMRLAFANQGQLEAAMAEAAADGKITPEEWEKIGGAAWNNFLGNMNVQDWADFALMLIPGARDGSKPDRERVEAAMKAKFMANVPAIGGQELAQTALMRRQLKAAAGETAGNS